MKLAPSAFVFLGMSLVGCAADQPHLGETTGASTVNDYSGSSGCSTAVVLGLGAQIAQESACLDPDNGFVAIADNANITYASNAVLPYLVQDAATDLNTEAATGHTLQITSALRTIPQQYLLYKWWQAGRCGITAAATVGNSNHEGGRAVDLANWSDRLQSMPANGWSHDVPGDSVHFDHTASADDRGRDVKAFQHLWNLNNPNDQIAEDGDYGPQTQARLQKSPATGFTTGPDCATSAHLANTVSVDGPDHVMSGMTAHYAFTLMNSSQTDWPDTTAVVVASGQPSQLYDSDSWDSPTQIGTLGQTVAAGDMVTFEFDVKAPVVSAELPIAEPLQLTDNGVQVGKLNLGVIVTMSPDDDSSEGSDPTPAGVTTGGCSTSGGGAGLLGALGIVGLLARRRRSV